MEVGKRKRLPESSPPPEILSAIFERLDARSLASARLVCREWRAIATPLVRAARLREGYLEPLESPRIAVEGRLSCVAAWGEILAVASHDGTVRLWTRDGDCVRVIDMEKPPWTMVAWGDFLAVGHLLGSVQLWNRDGEHVREIGRWKDAVWCLAVWGEFLAIGGRGIVRLCNREDECVREIHMRGDIVWNLEVWGHSLVCASFDGSVSLWNLEGERVHTLRESNVFCLAVLGDLLVCGSLEETVSLLNRESHRVMRAGVAGAVAGLTAWGETMACRTRDERMVFWGVPE